MPNATQGLQWSWPQKLEMKKAREWSLVLQHQEYLLLLVEKPLALE